MSQSIQSDRISKSTLARMAGNLLSGKHDPSIGEIRAAVQAARVIAAEVAESDGAVFDLAAHLRRQRRFSEAVFGPGARTAGVIDHIRRELLELEATPADLSEWIDVVLLAFDGAWRAGHEPEAIVAALEAKQTKNEGRRWPDWRQADRNQAIEHVRGEVV